MLPIPFIFRQSHLRDVQLFILLVTAISILPCAPVSIDEVSVEPEQGICIVEVREHLLLGYEHVEVL